MSATVDSGVIDVAAMGRELVAHGFTVDLDASGTLSVRGGSGIAVIAPGGMKVLVAERTERGEAFVALITSYLDRATP